ncbi:hypothetical protein QNO07_12590 [Streptomyces sp. 549]|uniref:alpha/beta hydrolase family protein n=1 Tax=Streptomyces sp. 549 TaxID=3049076 RepID=UPI0024C40926|nr:hypothetical protein [Streptomyces sp. 549]MDK1474246.1 hypothetical protein [Streptomyces sp. 549]
MRPRTAAAVAASTVLGTGAAAVAVGRYAAGGALRPRRRPAPPGFPAEALTVHTRGPDRVSLTRTLDSGTPGVYGLTGSGCHAAIGPLLDVPDASPDTVVRALLSVSGGDLRPGTRVHLTSQLHRGGPRDALGLAAADVRVPAPAGALPAWWVPGARTTWVIAVHGPGTDRDLALNLLPLLSGLGLPVLGLGLRGDPDAPAAPGGVAHLGLTEWLDVDAALHYAVREGAARIVLAGWSTGASAALFTAARSVLRDRVGALVLDSPVLDWRGTVRALAARRAPRVPAALALRAALGRAELDADRLDELADPHRPTVPALLLHGTEDPVASHAASRAFVEARPDLMQLHSFREARHAAAWNADPARCEAILQRFLTPHL